MQAAIQDQLRRAMLYGIVDLGYIMEDNIRSAAQGLIAGGADLIQLRAKNYSPQQVKKLAAELLPICRKASIPFIINDFPDVACSIGADGLHIGQEDGSLQDARAVVGDDMIIGRSTHSKEQAAMALAEGFDYIGFGPLFPTPTKKGRPSIGLQDLFYIQATIGSKIPVFCIGGIKRDNIDSVIRAGAQRLVIVSDLLTASSISAATSEAKTMLG